MQNTTRLKYACYSANVTMAAVGNLSPVLFLTFRALYGISYTLLGMLVLINFATQLIVDLAFSFFSHKFNIEKCVRSIPLISISGFIIYAVFPMIFPEMAYTGLVIGTIIFSSASGLAEVLISPVIAAIPSDDPDREMSKLHSVYAWGVVFVIISSTLFLLIFKNNNWHYLALLFTIIPLISAVLFSKCHIPKMQTPEKISGAVNLLKNKALWLSIVAMFIGGSAECTMAQWSSGYLEQALNIPKTIGDIIGVAGFALMLGLGRTLYAKHGKNIEKVVFLCICTASLCYLVCALSPYPVLGLLACALTGIATSMLWPGNLVIASQRFPQGGVFIFAMMASAGDLGASVGPQLVGAVTDMAIRNSYIADIAIDLNLTVEQAGMKLGMLCAMMFPLTGIMVYGILGKTKTTIK